MERNLSIPEQDYGEKIDDEVGRYLDQIHGEVSRTFDAALHKLSGDVRRQVQVGYLMCRIPDTIEDTNQLSTDQKYYLLNQYREVLESPSQRETGEFVRNVLNEADLSEEEQSSSYWDLVKNTHTVTSSFQAFEPGVQDYMIDAVDEMTQGMADFNKRAYQQDTEGIRIRDMEELEEYCHYVAGTVGELLTDLFSHHEDLPEGLNEKSEDFGQFLQTVNIIKDPVEDLEDESAIFIPEEALPDGKTHSDLEKALVNREPEIVERAVENLTDRANEKSDTAYEYIEMVPQGSKVRGYLEVPYLLAKATLREAEQNPGKALEGDLSIDRAEVMEILNKAGETEEFSETVKDVEKRPLHVS